MVNIYLATSLKSPRRQNGVVGYILEAEGHEDHTLTQFGRVINVTKNQSLLLDLIHALNRINTSTEVTIWSDNAYIQSTVENGWLKQWSENGWKTHKDKYAANYEEWKKITERLEELGGIVPQFRTGEHHKFKNYLETEVERREKRYV